MQSCSRQRNVFKRLPAGPETAALRKGLSASFAGFLLLIAAWHILLISAASAQDINSKAAVVIDAATGKVLFAKNPDRRLLPASTAKLMTSMIVLENAGLEDVVTISRKAAETAPSRLGLREGDRLTVETLLYAAVLKSANDAAVALAEAVAGSEKEFVKLMNQKAIALGAYDTKFVNANGLPGKGQHITAYDLSKIMRKAMEYPVLKRILGTRVAALSTESGRPVMIKNTNMLLWSDESVVGGKTGYTRRAGHCFVGAAGREDAVIIVSLLGAPSRDSLWEEAESLMDFGNKVMNHEEKAVIYQIAAPGDTAARMANAPSPKRIARRKK